jgi:hypothetical protein
MLCSHAPFEAKSHSGGIYHFINECTRNFADFAAARRSPNRERHKPQGEEIRRADLLPLRLVV